VQRCLAKFVRDVKDLEWRIRAELRPKALPRRLELGRDASDVIGRIPDTDDLDPTSLPIREHVVLPQTGGPSMDRPDILAVRLDNSIYAIERHIDPEHASDHGWALRSAIL
jgi:hypothetical protein